MKMSQRQSGEKSEEAIQEKISRSSDLSQSTYSQIVNIADIDKVDLNALVQSIV